MAWLPDGENFLKICFETIYERDCQTDKQTDGRTHSRHRMTAKAQRDGIKIEQRLKPRRNPSSQRSV